MCKIKTDGTDKQQIDSERAYKINVVESWIYYKDSDNGISRIKTNGSGKQQLTKTESVDINVIGDWVYYISGQNDILKRIKPDGTNDELLREGN